MTDPAARQDAASARACSKVILLGEHTVVYGAAAIAVGLDRGARASAWRGGSGQIRVGQQQAQADDGTPLGAAYAAALTALGAPRDIDAEALLEVPSGAGLGASAALGVSVSRAVLALLGRGASPSARAGADAWEAVYHGDPSGVDAATADSGGCIEFRKSTGANRLQLPAELVLAVALAGPPASTRAMVEKVRAFRALHPELFGKALVLCETLVARGRRYLLAGDLEGLGDSLNTNHDLLCTLGVSTPDLDEACLVARRHGALGAKLTGSGGGGCVVALTDGDASAVLAGWAAKGLKAFEARVRLADLEAQS
jgi:mevalonate kinase